jgi:hypothetical protein
MNYCNYFAEIEEHFAKRRSKHLLISPIDWNLVATSAFAAIASSRNLRYPLKLDSDTDSDPDPDLMGKMEK